MFRKLAIALSCLLIALFNQAAFANHQVTIKDAWIADAPSVATIRAAYLQLHNTGTHTITIKKFSSPDFSRIELHRTMVEGGMVKMEEVEHLSIKAGEQVEFKPGAYHLMLFTPKRKLNKDDKVSMQIQLEDGKISNFNAVVRNRGNSMQHDHEHHHH